MADVVGHLVVQALFGWGEVVLDRMRPSFGEQGFPFEGEQALLEAAAHQVGGVGYLPTSQPAPEAVLVQQGEEQHVALLLAAVRGSGEEQQVAGEVSQALPELVALGLVEFLAVVVG